MHRDDQSWKSFHAWIADYARVAGNEYEAVADLPADNWHGTQFVIRLRDVPQSWPDGATVQLLIHAAEVPATAPHSANDEVRWSERPVAFTQGTVTPRRIVNGALFLLAPLDEEQFRQWSEQHHQLPDGRYLVKCYVDRHQKLRDQPELLLDAGDFAGQVEIAEAQWRAGFPNAQWASGADLTQAADNR